jgi:hypothetical protein
MLRWDTCLTTRRRSPPVIFLKVRPLVSSYTSAVTDFFPAQSQGHNIRRYAEYLITRAKAFDACKTDHVRSGPGRLKRIGVDKGLLRETEIVQKQIRALLRCDVGAF